MVELSTVPVAPVAIGADRSARRRLRPLPDNSALRRIWGDGDGDHHVLARLAASQDLTAMMSPRTARQLSALQPLLPNPPSTPTTAARRLPPGTPRTILERQRLQPLQVPRARGGSGQVSKAPSTERLGLRNAPASTNGSVSDSRRGGRSTSSRSGSEHFGTGKFEDAAGIYRRVPGISHESPRAKLATTALLYQGKWPSARVPAQSSSTGSFHSLTSSDQPASRPGDCHDPGKAGRRRRKKDSEQSASNSTFTGFPLWYRIPRKSDAPKPPVWPKRFMCGAFDGQPPPFRLAPQPPKVTPELQKEAAEAAAFAIRMMSRSPTGGEQVPPPTKAKWKPLKDVLAKGSGSVPTPLAVWYLKLQLDKWEPALTEAKRDMDSAGNLKGSEAWQNAKLRYKQVEYKVSMLRHELEQLRSKVDRAGKKKPLFKIAVLKIIAALRLHTCQQEVPRVPLDSEIAKGDVPFGTISAAAAAFGSGDTDSKPRVAFDTRMMKDMDASISLLPTDSKPVKGDPNPKILKARGH